MKVLVTGATGYLGSAICAALAADGRDVVAGVRQAEQGAALRAQGYGVAVADLAEPDSLGRAAGGVDAVIHAAAIAGPQRAAADHAAVRAMLEALAGRDAAFVYTSGTWVLGDTGDSVATESWPCRPLPANGWQLGVEETVLSAAGRGLRTAVVRPATVHGAGGGALAAFVNQARKRGSARVVGNGSQLWSTVHRDDLADLYVRALRGIDAGGVFHAASGCAYPVRDLALAAALAVTPAARVEEWPLGEARARMGEIADALAMTQRVDSPRARSVLGWVPRGPTAIEDLLIGSYRGG